LTRDTRNLARAILLGFVAVGLVAGLVRLDGPSSIGSETPTSRSGVELSVQYDSDFINAWVEGCVASGESRGFCRCAIDEYTARLRPDEFETASVVAQSGGSVAELPERLRDAVETVEREC
jgi:hypothetical protein